MPDSPISINLSSYRTTPSLFVVLLTVLFCGNRYYISSLFVVVRHFVFTYYAVIQQGYLSPCLLVGCSIYISSPPTTRKLETMVLEAYLISRSIYMQTLHQLLLFWINWICSTRMHRVASTINNHPVPSPHCQDTRTLSAVCTRYHPGGPRTRTLHPVYAW